MFSKLTYIDENGKLFGIINLLDFAVLVGAVILLYLGGSAYLALKTSAPEILAFDPKQISGETASKITLFLQNERIITLLTGELVPRDFVGERKKVTAAYTKRRRKDAVLSVPAGVPAGNYLIELEITTQDALNRQTKHIVVSTEPIKVLGEEPVPVESDKPDTAVPVDTALVAPAPTYSIFQLTWETVAAWAILVMGVCKCLDLILNRRRRYDLQINKEEG